MVEISQITNVFATGKGSVQRSSLTFSQNDSRFLTPYKVENDSARKASVPLFNLSSYRTGQRSQQDISAAHGVILDFDNEDGSTEDPEIFANELEGLSWLYYTTYSHTESRPKFRVVLPFSRGISLAAIKEEGERVLAMLGHPGGVDPSTFDPSRFFYLPCVHPDREQFFRVEAFTGALYEPEATAAPKSYVLKKEAPARPASRETAPVFTIGKKYAGRNDALKSQAAACIEKGKEVQEALAELIAYDQEKHTPPLFEDPSEGGIEGNPVPAALKFLANIQATFKRSETTLTMTNNALPAMDVREAAEQAKAAPNKKDRHVLDKSLLAAPGFVGEVSAWITETASKPQPSLSLAATLSMLGMVKAHRVRSESDLRTNIYTLGLAPSGGGKEHPGRAVKLLLKKSGHELHVVGEPRSGSGLLRSLKNARGQALLLWSEMGQGLKYSTQKNAAGHQSEIIKHLTQLFSDASTDLVGGEYANSDGKRAREDISQPCLSIFASTVPGEFYESINEAHGSNGFLARWLVFHADNPKVPLRPEKQLGEAPKDFIAQLVRIKGMSTNVESRGNLDKSAAIRPLVVPFDAAARSLSMDVVHDFEQRWRDALDHGTGLESIWARGYEHTIKIALIVSQDSFVTRPQLEWSYNLTLNLLQSSSLLFLRHAGKGEFAKSCDKALMIISANSNGVSRSDLGRRMKMRTKALDEVLEYLLSFEQVVAGAEKGKTKPTIRYFAPKR